MNVKTKERKFTRYLGGHGLNFFGVRSIAWKPDGSQLVVVGEFQAAYILDADSGFDLHVIHKRGCRVMTDPTI